MPAPRRALATSVRAQMSKVRNGDVGADSNIFSLHVRDARAPAMDVHMTPVGRGHGPIFLALILSALLIGVNGYIGVL